MYCGYPMASTQCFDSNCTAMVKSEVVKQQSIYLLFLLSFVTTSLSYSAGCWTAYKVANRPPPIGAMDMVMIDSHHAVLYGGRTIVGRICCVFLFNFQTRVRHWSITSQQRMKLPQHGYLLEMLATTVMYPSHCSIPCIYVCRSSLSQHAP